MLFGVVAHEELLDLQARRIPPRQTHKKCVGSGAAGEPGGLRVEKKPLVGIGGFENGAFGIARRHALSRRQQQAQHGGVGSAHLRARIPLPRDQVLAVAIAAGFCAEQQRQAIPASARCERRSGSRRRDRFQRRDSGEAVLEIFCHVRSPVAYAKGLPFTRCTRSVTVRQSRMASAASLPRSPCVARRPHAGRAALLARARRDQFARLR